MYKSQPSTKPYIGEMDYKPSPQPAQMGHVDNVYTHTHTETQIHIPACIRNLHTSTPTPTSTFRPRSQIHT